MVAEMKEEKPLLLYLLPSLKSDPSPSTPHPYSQSFFYFGYLTKIQHYFQLVCFFLIKTKMPQKPHMLKHTPFFPNHLFQVQIKKEKLNREVIYCSLWPLPIQGGVWGCGGQYPVRHS